MASSIKLVVSSCLLGNAVRYDGRHQFHELIASNLSSEFEVISVCPELMAGLGVPRPPVQLIHDLSGVSALGVEDASLDVTFALESMASQFIEQHQHVDGFILKARSPSCGVTTTPLFNTKGEEIDRTNGLFARKIIQTLAGIPIVDESQLTSQAEIDEFLAAVKSYHAMHHNAQAID